MGSELRHFQAVEHQADEMAKQVVRTMKGLVEAARNGLFDAEELVPEVPDVSSTGARGARARAYTCLVCACMCVCACIFVYVARHAGAL